MNIQFDSASLTIKEAQALTAFLSVLHGQAQQSTPTTLHEQLKASVDQAPSGPVLVEQTEPTTTRHRRTKAEMAAAKDAPADPTQGSNVQAAAASGTTGPATVSSTTAPAGEAKPISADDLRTLLNSYIKKHGMDEAIAQLKRFGCNRVTEALALDPVKLNELASVLNA